MNDAVEAIRLFKSLNRIQRHTFLACFLGWALDALDFFLLTFVLVPISREFGRSIPEVAFAITLTLMARPIGAFLFGLLGDKFGRRIPLMIDIVFYSLMELLTAFAPNFTVFLVLRVLFATWTQTRARHPPGEGGWVRAVLSDGRSLQRGSVTSARGWLTGWRRKTGLSSCPMSHAIGFGTPGQHAAALCPVPGPLGRGHGTAVCGG